MNILTFSATVELSGPYYTCSVPTVPEIIPVVYNLIVRRKLIIGGCVGLTT